MGGYLEGQMRLLVIPWSIGDLKSEELLDSLKAGMLSDHAWLSRELWLSPHLKGRVKR